MIVSVYVCACVCVYVYVYERRPQSHEQMSSGAAKTPGQLVVYVCGNFHCHCVCAWVRVVCVWVRGWPGGWVGVRACVCV